MFERCNRTFAKSWPRIWTLHRPPAAAFVHQVDQKEWCHASAASFVLSLCLSGCATLAGPGAGASSAAAKRAKGLVGHDISEASNIFGHPDIVANGMYMWSYSGKFVGTRFVQTGSQYLGSQMVGATPSGNGVAGAPVYRDQYRPIGYYAPVTARCVMTITTDEYGLITKTGTLGTACDTASKLWLSGDERATSPGNKEGKLGLRAKHGARRYLGCHLAGLNPAYSPVALYPAVADGILLGKPGDGVALYIVAGAFSHYDALRTAGEAATDAQKRLMDHDFRSLDPAKMAMFYKLTAATMKVDKLRTVSATCWLKSGHLPIIRDI